MNTRLVHANGVDGTTYQGWGRVAVYRQQAVTFIGNRLGAWFDGDPT